MNIRKILYQDFETKIAKNRVELADLMISDKEGSRLNKDKMTTYNLLGFIFHGSIIGITLDPRSGVGG